MTLQDGKANNVLAATIHRPLKWLKGLTLIVLGAVVCIMVLGCIQATTQVPKGQLLAP